MVKSSSAISSDVFKVNRGEVQMLEDTLAVEEPLEISLSYGVSPKRYRKSISVTMRTPGNDAELAIGFLYTEGIISGLADISYIKRVDGRYGNALRVDLKEEVQVNINRLDRNFYTSSSCGTCGKTSLEAVKTICKNAETQKDTICFSAELIYALPQILRNKQSIFDATGGLHGCGLFNSSGNLCLSREDVGRHNALDKLIGAALQQDLSPLNHSLLLLSGRVSFELIQKAYVAGIKVVAAVGAPSSLAVQTAGEFGMTLIGFLRGETFNIYSGAHRVIIPVNELPSKLINPMNEDLLNY